MNSGCRLAGRNERPSTGGGVGNCWDNRSTSVPVRSRSCCRWGLFLNFNKASTSVLVDSDAAKASAHRGAVESTCTNEGVQSLCRKIRNSRELPSHPALLNTGRGSHRASRVTSAPMPLHVMNNERHAGDVLALFSSLSSDHLVGKQKTESCSVAQLMVRPSFWDHYSESWWPEIDHLEFPSSQDNGQIFNDTC